MLYERCSMKVKWQSTKELLSWERLKDFCTAMPLSSVSGARIKPKRHEIFSKYWYRRLVICTWCEKSSKAFLSKTHVRDAASSFYKELKFYWLPNCVYTKDFVRDDIKCWNNVMFAAKFEKWLIFLRLFRKVCSMRKRSHISTLIISRKIEKG